MSFGLFVFLEPQAEHKSSSKKTNTNHSNLPNKKSCYSDNSCSLEPQAEHKSGFKKTNTNHSNLPNKKYSCHSDYSCSLEPQAEHKSVFKKTNTNHSNLPNKIKLRVIRTIRVPLESQAEHKSGFKKMNTNHSNLPNKIKIRVIRTIRVLLKHSSNPVTLYSCYSDNSCSFKNSVLRVPSVLAHPVRTRANAQRSERSDNSLHHSIHNLIPRDLIRVRIQV